MPKAGILHDYDLMANAEPAARSETTVCPICDAAPPSYQWSDYRGQAMCTICGCPFQLKWGSEAQEKEAQYPYLEMKAEWVPIAREYWQERKAWVCYGWMLGPRPGFALFNDWAKRKHPEMYVERVAGRMEIERNA